MIAQADEPVAASHFTLGVIDTSNQTASEFLNEYNSRLVEQKPGAKRRGGKVLGDFRLIEVRADQLVADKELPIDRLRDGEAVSYAHEVRFTTATGYQLSASTWSLPSRVESNPAPQPGVTGAKEAPPVSAWPSGC